MNGFARAVGINRQTILRAEQGTFNGIPPVHLHFLSERTSLPSSSITTSYTEWVAERRRSNFNKLSSTYYLERHFEKYPTLHPLVVWRRFSGIQSRIEVCKLFCVHQSTVTRFESPRLPYTEIPDQLHEALSESGYSNEVLTLFSDDYKRYREWALALRHPPVGRLVP